jgi:uncharacterized membrane protein YciS (DUF1049 family)
MWVIRWFFTLLVLVILILFSISNLGNNTDITVVPGYLHYTSVSVIWIVAVSFIIGMLVSFIIAVVNYFQLSRLLKKKDRQISQLQQELSAMRNLPLDDAGTKEEGA